LEVLNSTSKEIAWRFNLYYLSLELVSTLFSVNNYLVNFDFLEDILRKSLID